MSNDNSETTSIMVSEKSSHCDRGNEWAILTHQPSETRRHDDVCSSRFS